MMTKLRTILVPIDFSPGSFAAAERARDIAAVFNGNVHLLHVANPPDESTFTVEPFWQDWQLLQEPTRLQALDRLATLSLALQFYPIHTTGVVRFGHATDVIRAYAREIHADLIVMGIHGDHHIAVGDVIESVLGSTRCAVLAIPEPMSKTVELRAVEQMLAPEQLERVC